MYIIVILLLITIVGLLLPKLKQSTIESFKNNNGRRLYRLLRRLDKLRDDKRELVKQTENLGVEISTLKEQKVADDSLIKDLNEKVNKLEKYTKHLQKINVSNL